MTKYVILILSLTNILFAEYSFDRVYSCDIKNNNIFTSLRECKGEYLAKNIDYANVHLSYDKQKEKIYVFDSKVKTISLNVSYAQWIDSVRYEYSLFYKNYFISNIKSKILDIDENIFSLGYRKYFFFKHLALFASSSIGLGTYKIESKKDFYSLSIKTGIAKSLWGLNLALFYQNTLNIINKKHNITNISFLGVQIGY